MNVQFPATDGRSFTAEDDMKSHSMLETGVTNNDISRFTINNKRNQNSLKIDFLGYQSKQSDLIVSRKIVFLGNSGVGKSSIIRSLIHGHSQQDQSISQTIGAELFIKDISMTNQKLRQQMLQRMQIWDTTGQEKFRSLTPIHYRDADAFILVFGLNHRQSFDALQDYWIPSLLNYAPQELIIAVVGTFSDQQNQSNEDRFSEITLAEIQKLTDNQLINYNTLTRFLLPSNADQVNLLFKDLALKLETTNHSNVSLICINIKQSVRSRYKSVKLSTKLVKDRNSSSKSLSNTLIESKKKKGKSKCC